MAGENEITWEGFVKFVGKKYYIDETKIKKESKLEEDLGFDSLDSYELNWGFEDKFGIDMPDERFKKIETAGDAYKAVLIRTSDKYRFFQNGEIMNKAALLMAEYFSIRRRVLPRRNLWHDFGIDLADVKNRPFFSEIQVKLGVEFSETKIDELETVGDLYRHLLACKGRPSA